MKRSVLILLLTGLASLAMAQRPGFQFGMSGTMDQFQFDYHPCHDGDTSKIPCGSTLQEHDNFGIGVALQWRTSDRSFLRIMPTYCSKGFSVQYNRSFTFPGDPFVVTSTEMHLYYADVPILTGFRVVESRRFALVGMAGPVPGFRLWGRETSRFALAVSRESDVLDLTYSRMLLGMHGQAAIEARLDPFLVIEAGAWGRWSPTPVIREIENPNSLSYGFALTVLVNFPTRLDQEPED